MYYTSNNITFTDTFKSSTVNNIRFNENTKIMQIQITSDGMIIKKFELIAKQ